MIRFLVDEDFSNDLVRGLLRRVPEADLVRVQDVGLRGASDETVLARAASEGRVVLTHDVSTLIARAYERVRAGDQMPGVIGIVGSKPGAGWRRRFVISGDTERGHRLAIKTSRRQRSR